MGWLAVKQYVDNAKPLAILLENVVGLLADNGDSSSDADHICQELKKRGYWCCWTVLDARDYGSFAARRRVYFLATRQPRPGAAAMVTQVFQGTTCGPGSAEAFIKLGSEELAALMSKLPDPEASGLRMSQHGAIQLLT